MAKDNKSHKIILYGANWCGDCHRSRQLLDDLKVEYEYIDIEKDSEAAKKVVEINKGYQSIPTIVFPDNHVLVEPSNDELKKEIDHLKDKNIIVVHKQM
ncbi:MAG: NrdH-redoxin [Candidatus Portnoybacteria bacterium CG10_big_fil_rev_8_21_14_0_10_36_7]|uniref:NrdH-redoxin n=1 Tax=Candidatus Portnoybacteria bacterium CG10_big_fil_rev_8_21_14_0_10_36_7 TaxID=1974812 RepID=A0A2M8KDL7_9BACT|nr:MAG: NrdH-redoxin [Candidatus Portnoybacteria bacterium CG10_big_fil_rev_8_21_14_0_10_36_7]